MEAPMKIRRMFFAVTLALLVSSYLALAQPPAAQPPAGQPPAAPQPMSFFVTSVGAGNGANLGGLAGADRHCQALAMAVGAGGKTWHAYLSANAAGGQGPLNARARTGAGPSYNAQAPSTAHN